MIEALKALWEALKHTMSKYEGGMTPEDKAALEELKAKLKTTQEANHALLLEQTEALRLIAEMEEYLKNHG